MTPSPKGRSRAEKKPLAFEPWGQYNQLQFMRLAHLSDFHFTKLTPNPLRLFSKRMIGHLNWFFLRKGDFCFAQTDPLPELFSSLGVDLILLGGDLTSTAMKEEFCMAQALVQKMGKPWIAIPGNHDQYTSRSHRKKMFYRYFTNSNPSFAYRLSTDGIEAHNIAPSWWVVCLDTARPTPMTSSSGLFSQSQEEKLELVLQAIPLDDKIVLFNHYPYFSQEGEKRSLKRSDALENILRKHPQIVLYLHGHTHRHSMANLTPSQLPVTIDSGSCCLKRGGSWNLIDLESNRCTITPYYWNNRWEEQKTRQFIFNPMNPVWTQKNKVLSL